jgi:hypothetical protein
MVFFETIKNVIVAGVVISAIAWIVFVLFKNVGANAKLTNFVELVSSAVFTISIFVTTILTMGTVLGLALIPNGLSKETKLSISNYVAKMSEQDYSRLEKLVKLYGNQLSCEDGTIKQINKHLTNTVGK